jgi:hypothetical protein
MYSIFAIINRNIYLKFDEGVGLRCSQCSTYKQNNMKGEYINYLDWGSQFTLFMYIKT